MHYVYIYMVFKKIKYLENNFQEFFKKVLYNCNNPVLRIYQEFSLPGL